MSINTINKKNYSLISEDSYENIHNNNKIFGFWIYLMSDCIIFTVLFSSYYILYNVDTIKLIHKNFIDINFIFIETIILLLSSIIYGYTNKVLKNKKLLFFLLCITFILGMIFIIMEFIEFSNLLSFGINPNKSAFISSFFTIIGTHGAHVIVGLIWIIVLMYKIFLEYDTKNNKVNILCLGMYWHFLDIIWIFVFSFIYLMDSI